MVVGGLSSDQAERVCAPKTQRPQFDPKFVSKLCIGHDDIGGLQASQAEGLAGCRTDKNVFQKSLIQRTVADELSARHDQITVKLVSDDPHAVFGTDLGIAAEFFPAPHPSDRVVRTT